MLHFHQGDKGETVLFCCQQKLAKSAPLIEALGAVDELVSFLGVVKMAADKKIAKIIAQVQQDLFIIQAELAGAKKKISAARVVELEKIINGAAPKLSAIKTFVIPGGTKLSAQLDYARAVARRAERRVVAVAKKQKTGAPTLAYLNRLSSLLYVLARLENLKSGIKEEKPRY